MHVVCCWESCYHWESSDLASLGISGCSVVGDLQIPNAFIAGLWPARMSHPHFFPCGFGNPHGREDSEIRMDEMLGSITNVVFVVGILVLLGISGFMSLGIFGSPTFSLRVCDPRGWHIRIYSHADSEIRMDGKHPHGRKIRMDEHERKQQDITRWNQKYFLFGWDFIFYVYLCSEFSSPINSWWGERESGEKPELFLQLYSSFIICSAKPLYRRYGKVNK